LLQLTNTLCHTMKKQLSLMLIDMRSRVQRLSADKMWGESTLSELHTAAKIETLEARSASFVDPANWDRFKDILVKEVVREGAEQPEEKLRTELDKAFISTSHLAKLFDISLNYTAGGCQYMSCITCATRKMEGGQILVLYSMYGKRWIEHKEYMLNRNFWESAPVPEKLKNFLECGVAVGMQSLLEEDVPEEDVQSPLKKDVKLAVGSGARVQKASMWNCFAWCQ